MRWPVLGRVSLFIWIEAFIEHTYVQCLCLSVLCGGWCTFYLYCAIWWNSAITSLWLALASAFVCLGCLGFVSLNLDQAPYWMPCLLIHWVVCAVAPPFPNLWSGWLERTSRLRQPTTCDETVMSYPPNPQILVGFMVIWVECSSTQSSRYTVNTCVLMWVCI